MSSSSASDSELELSEESQSSDGSSSVEEISRLSTTTHGHDGYPADIVFADPEFEPLGPGKFLLGDGYEDEEYDGHSGLLPRKKGRSKDKCKLVASSRRKHREPESSGCDDTSDSDSDSDSVISRRKSRRSPRRSTLTSRSGKRVDSKRHRDTVES